MARLAAERHYSPDMLGILDMRTATVKLTMEDLQQLTDAIKASPRLVARARRALLVGSESAYNFYQKFASMAGNGRIEYQVFRDEHAAKDWIDEAIAKRRLGQSATSLGKPGGKNAHKCSRCGSVYLVQDPVLTAIMIGGGKSYVTCPNKECGQVDALS
jgi:hypothetical protein